MPNESVQFSTMADAIGYVETALADFSHEYDTEAIARECFEWFHGMLYLVRDGAAFWDSVMRHELS